MVITSNEFIYFTGIMSDGSDKEQHVAYNVTVVDGTKTYFKICDVVPTEADIDLSTFQDITPPPTNKEIADNQLIIMSALADLYSALPPTT